MEIIFNDSIRQENFQTMLKADPFIAIVSLSLDLNNVPLQQVNGFSKILSNFGVVSEIFIRQL